MPGKPPAPDGDALWRRVTETVTPLKGRAADRTAGPAAGPPPPIVPAAIPPSARPAPRQREPGETLDGGWDRRLRRGVVTPDITVDLHGHTLVAAHAVLEAELARAVARRLRVILLITGRPPRDTAERIDGRPVRGAIRASIADWLRHSVHAGHIAAVRNAHPRHGGAGALYVILRRDGR